jgi:DinB superfamily
MTEAWLSGPVDGVHPLLMPAAHALVQVRQELPLLLEGLTTEQIWTRPGQSASIGYHALHLAGAIDRLLTYARGEELNAAQVGVLVGERSLSGLTASHIVDRVHRVIDAALDQIRGTPAASLADPRAVGRRRLPSTVIGLTFHAAEHATRHAGQIATLRKIV